MQTQLAKIKWGKYYSINHIHVHQYSLTYGLKAENIFYKYTLDILKRNIEKPRL